MSSPAYRSRRPRRFFGFRGVVCRLRRPEDNGDGIARPPRQPSTEPDRALQTERARFAERERAVVPRAVYGYSAASQKARERPPSRFWLLCGLLLLSLTLSAQLAFLYRKPLLKQPQISELLKRASAQTGMVLPPIDEPERIALLSRSVDKHPSEARALLVNLNLSNQADYAVRFPWIELKMSDLNGRAVAMRRFAPEEYLAEPARIKVGMAGGDLLAVSLELEDPGQDALAFEFAFR